jgi:hypothetical protein
MNLKFSLTFHDSDYEVDCTLGTTLGRYFSTADRIYFTPTKVGINSGDVGKSNIWDYRFHTEDSFTLSSGPLSVRLYRKR